jgi:hypothetical protein
MMDAMMTMTPEQWRVIEQAGEQPIELTDSNTQATYVLIRADLYHELLEIADDEA